MSIKLEEYFREYFTPIVEYWLKDENNFEFFSNENGDLIYKFSTFNPSAYEMVSTAKLTKEQQ